MPITEERNENSTNMLISANSFSTLKKTLLENIGSNKTHSFLFQFGYDIGVNASIEKSIQSDLTKHRGKNSMHAMYGQVKDVIIDPNFEQLLSGEIKYISGKWIDSFEANAHLKYFKHTDKCVCYTLCGYVNGFLWNKFKAPLVTIETKCKANGHAYCEFEIRLEENWDREQEDIIEIYKNAALATQVDVTYDALLTHKNLVDKISDFYSSLTNSVTQKHSMQQILQTAFKHLNIPILLEDLHGEKILQIGLTENELKQLAKESTELHYVESVADIKYYESKSFIKLTSSVLINKKAWAKCSFIYSTNQVPDKNDHLFLERLSNVIALSFLYEQAQHEELDRVSHTILDRLSRKQYLTLKDIEPYFKQYSFKFIGPFYTMALKITSPESIEKIDLHEYLPFFSKSFNEYNIDGIFSTLGDEIVFLVLHPNEYFHKYLTKILSKLQKQYPKLHFKTGIGSEFDDLLNFPQSLKQAQLAQKFDNKKKITQYHELGILGQFVANLPSQQLHDIAKEMLNELYDFQELRNKEMLYTLYRFLINGQKLKETMADLSLSMGGLQYRIRQIEDMLNKSLKNASFTSYLLLVIEALILSNELNFNEFD